ncbi:MAG: YihA family ribosome biogenesis GTP-binding protein [Alphaproteobacteria bacterium]|nr:YihA family ribosome biogenesis GTP-binding protein [Alphaproteobacteria bacterium]
MTKREIRQVFSGPCDFRWGVAVLSQLPEFSVPEISFAGRSNVGKSSLINALMDRKIAHVSHTPGRTQQLNFFDVGGTFWLVDMPGYGYAKVSKAKKSEWDQLIIDYLRGRPSLRVVFLLIDGRHGLKDIDRETMKMLDAAAVSYRIILTKADEPKPADLERIIAETTAELKKHPAAYPQVFPVSALEKTGLDELRQMILEIVA